MKKIYMILTLVVALFVADIPKAQANLLITPLRAVFEGRDRSTIITLINTGDTTRTYRMAWQLLKMTETGQYDRVESFVDAQGNDISAAGMLRFSPRQVTIEPQGRQRIRLSVRRSSELKDGEYRAHLQFTQLADDRAVSVAEDSTSERGQTLILQTNMAFTIPVIVRQGSVTPSVSISDAKFAEAQGKDPRPRLNVVLNSDAPFSTFGRLKVFKGGKEIGLLNNVSVFPEISKRFVSIPIKDTTGLDKVGQVEVVYEGMDEYMGTIFDRKTFDLR